MNWINVKNLLPECYNHELSDPVLIIYVLATIPYDHERVSIACYSHDLESWFLVEPLMGDMIGEHSYFPPHHDKRIKVLYWGNIPLTPAQQKDYDYKFAVQAFDNVKRKIE